MTPQPGSACDQSWRNVPAVIRGMSIASANKCDVFTFRNAAANPLSGPREGGSSSTTSISGGHHAGRTRAETHSASGFNSRSSRSCLAQSGSPANSSVALSTPMRCERPPTNNTAVKDPRALKGFGSPGFRTNFSVVQNHRSQPAARCRWSILHWLRKRLNLAEETRPKAHSTATH